MHTRWRLPGSALGMILVLVLSGCQAATTGQAPAPSAGESRQEVGNMQITSPAFQYGESIPSKYTCDGEDVSLPLAWSGVPDGAKSLALVCEDPDAPMGTWIHWIVLNLPPGTTALPENGPLPAGAVQITNSFGKIQYGGPCPPGGTHRYFFKLYALDVATLDGLTRDNYETILIKHTLIRVELMGTYQR